MRKLRQMTARSESQRVWGEELRTKMTELIVNVRRNEEMPDSERDLAYKASYAIPYMSNIASDWIDRYSKMSVREFGVYAAEYLDMILNNTGFVNRVAESFDGLEEEYVDVIRSLKGSTTLALIEDEDTEIARSVAEGILEVREEEEARLNRLCPQEVFFA